MQKAEILKTPPHSSPLETLLFRQLAQASGIFSSKDASHTTAQTECMHKLAKNMRSLLEGNLKISFRLALDEIRVALFQGEKVVFVRPVCIPNNEMTPINWISGDKKFFPKEECPLESLEVARQLVAILSESGQGLFASVKMQGRERQTIVKPEKTRTAMNSLITEETYPNAVFVPTIKHQESIVFSHVRIELL